MTNNGLNFPISITPVGIEKVSQIPAIINNIAKSAQSVNASVSPLDRLMKVLTNIEQILMEIGRVGVGSFNKLNDIWATNHQGFNKVNGQAVKLEKEIDKIGKTSKKSGQEVKSGFLDNFNKIGFAINSVKNIAGTIANVVGPIFKEGMARQNAVTDFSTLLGIPDPEEARAMAQKYADDLRSTNAATLYGAGTLNDNAKSMLAYGVDAETSFQILESLGDVAMGDANKMNSLATAFSQMWSLGKLQTQDWKQMVGAGFNPFNQMQKDLGKTTEELDEMMSKGKITAEMTRDAFLHATQASYYDIEGKIQYATDKESLEKAQKEFDEANEKLAAEGKQKKEWKVEKGQFFGALQNTMDNTLQGKMASIMSSFDDLKARVFELLMPIAEKLVPLIKDSVLPLVEKCMPLIEGVAWLLGELTDYIQKNWEELSTLVIGIGAVVGAIMLLTSPVTWIVVAIGAIAAGLVWLVKNWEEWHDVVVAINYPLAVLIDIIMSVKKHWDQIISGFKDGGAIEGIKRLGLAILDGILRPVESLMKMLSKVEFLGLGNIAGWLGDKVTSLRDQINGAFAVYEAVDALKPDTNPQESNETQDTLENTVKGAGGKGGLGKATKDKTESVASGGTRNTQITINLDNMVETVNFNGGVEENAQRTTDTFVECLLRALYSAQTAV